MIFTEHRRNIQQKNIYRKTPMKDQNCQRGKTVFSFLESFNNKNPVVFKLKDDKPVVQNAKLGILSGNCLNLRFRIKTYFIIICAVSDNAAPTECLKIKMRKS